MTQTIGVTELKAIFAELSNTMTENFQLLTDLDAASGDGDLGITMTKGFAAAARTANDYAEKDAGKLLLLAGMAIAKEAPSTLGTLIASGFMKGSKEVTGKEVLTLTDSAHLLTGFVQGVMDRGKAKPGDKTIIDALLPAAEALEAAGPDSPFADAWALALQAAEKGLEGTREMRAQQGRAAYYGDNSIGKLDPGATVGVLLVRTIAQAVR